MTEIDKKLCYEIIKKAEKNGYNYSGEKLCVFIPSVIFSHDFAKAFWGEEVVTVQEWVSAYNPIRWQYHISKMVLEKEPLKYLEKFL